MFYDISSVGFQNNYTCMQNCSKCVAVRTAKMLSGRTDRHIQENIRLLGVAYGP